MDARGGRFMELEIVGVGGWTVIKPPKHLKEDIKRKLTYTYRDITDKLITIYAYEEHDGLLYVPRNFIPVEPAGYWDTVDIEFDGQLTDVQKTLFADAIDGLTKHYGGVIHATTGIGKTVLTLAIASYLKLRTLVIVPTYQIALQWAEAVTKFTNTEPGMIRQDTVEIAPITIAMIQSLCARNGYDLHRETFGLVVWDEVHLTPTAVYSATATMFNSKYRLGLSATPFRRDGLHWLIKLHIGGIIAKYMAKEVVPRVLLVNYFGIPYAMRGLRNEFQLGLLLTSLIKDQHRVELLAGYTRSAYDRGREILVLSDRIQLLDLIKEASGIPESDCGYMIGGKKKKDAQVLFGTYACAGIGFDKPTLDTLIFATPRADVEQAVGRMMRKGNKKNQPLVIDIIDKRCPDLAVLSKKRLKFYEYCGCEIVETFKEVYSYGKPTTQGIQECSSARGELCEKGIISPTGGLLR